MSEAVGKFTEADHWELVDAIQRRYAIDGEPITLQEAERLLLRLDTEADYLGAYIND